MLATETSVSTTTVSSAVATASNFALLANVDGNYCAPSNNEYTYCNQISPANSQVYTIDSDCHLVAQGGDYAGQVAIRCDLATDPYYVFLGPAANLAGNECNALTCSVVPATNQLLCSTNNFDVSGSAVYDTFYLDTARHGLSLETVLLIGSANSNNVGSYPGSYNMTTITIVFV